MSPNLNRKCVAPLAALCLVVAFAAVAQAQEGRIPGDAPRLDGALLDAQDPLVLELRSMEDRLEATSGRNRGSEGRRANRRADFKYNEDRHMDRIDHKPSIPFRANLTDGEKEEIERYRDERNEFMGKYFEKRRDLQRQLYKLEPGTDGARRIEQELWNLEMDRSREQLRFHEQVKDYLND